MKIEAYHFPSATGVCEIHGNVYTPDNGEVKAVLAIHHGMAEYQKRYLAFIEYLTANGYAVFMHDMANHGMSNQNKALTGFFGKKDGYKNLVADFNTTFTKAKNTYPNKKIIVMGHSMGSFIVRCFTAWYNNAGFDGAIYMGTGGKNPIAGIGDAISSVAAKLTGYTHKSKFIDKLTFGSYNSKFEKRTPSDWLTRDKAVVDQFIADDECGFIFSAQGMNDLVKLNISANSDEWYNSVPKNIDILLISGDMDPVGDYAKGIKEIYEKLKATGHARTQLKLYPQCRHEVLNELNKTDVYADINKFIEDVIQ